MGLREWNVQNNQNLMKFFTKAQLIYHTHMHTQSTVHFCTVKVKHLSPSNSIRSSAQSQNLDNITPDTGFSCIIKHIHLIAVETMFNISV